MEYSFDCKIRKLSAKTIENYQKQLRYLQRYLEQEYGVKEVEEVRAYQIKELLSMMDDKQRKPRYDNAVLVYQWELPDGATSVLPGIGDEFNAIL